MGRSKQQRRKDQQRRVQQRHRSEAEPPQPAEPRPRGEADLSAVAAQTLAEAVHALHRQRLAEVDQLVDRLAALAPHPEGSAALSAALVAMVRRALAGLWSSGWQPVDVVAVVTRNRGQVHAHLVAAGIADEHHAAGGRSVHPDWAAQVHQLSLWPQGPPPGTAWLAAVAPGGLMATRVALEAALELLLELTTLPRIPELMPPPGSPGARVAASQPVSMPRDEATGPLDQKMLVRVRALLAKAESTDFPEEAESLTVKAQELMARHAIDEAMLHAGATQGEAAARRIHLVAPYVDAKASLLDAVASANRCRAVLVTALGFVTVFGFPGDLEAVDVLFTSLLSQATAALVAEGRVMDRAGTSRTRSFRQAFLLAYAARIGERLRDAAAHTVQEATATHGAALVPVLDALDAAVDAKLSEVFPKLVRRSSRRVDAAGWHAGRAAADQASLGAQGQVGRGRTLR